MAPSFLADETATLACGTQLAAACAAAAADQKTPLIVTLSGPLGAGKTTLARAVVQALGHGGVVKSPTYTLVEPYDTRPPVWHMDLYRLEAPEAFEDLGLEPEPGLWLVEWPDRAAGFLPSIDLEIALDYESTGRQLMLTALSDRGQRALQCFSGSLEGDA